MGFKIEDIFNLHEDKIIQEYVEKLEQDIRKRVFDINPENDKDILQMRGDLLHEDLYSCMIGGRSISLQEMLFGSESVGTSQNIIIITGERHIGKNYFANILLKTCMDSMKEVKPYFTWKSAREIYRIPIVLSYERHWEEGKKIELSELIMEAIREKSTGLDNEDARKKLKGRVEYFLEGGRFLIYLEGDRWFGELKGELKQVLVSGEIVKNYRKRVKYHNLVVAAAEADMDIKETSLKENCYTLIHLDKLTENEVMSYLNEYIPNLQEMAKDKTILEILRHPRYLKMFEALCERNALQYDFEFYDYLLRESIRRKLLPLQKGRAAENRTKSNRNVEEVVLRELKEHAIRLSQNKKVDTSNISRHFLLTDFSEAGILNEEGEFVFPQCGYYLVAQSIVEQLKKEMRYEIPKCFLEDPLEIILIWVGRIIEDSAYFMYFWRSLMKSRCKVLLLTKIYNNSRFKKIVEDEFHDRVFSSLRDDFYDCSVLETLMELGEDGVVYMKAKYPVLSEKYNEVEKNNIKKRLVYFLGISRKGIIGKMLDELMEEGTDLHLRYHIIRAAVENYGAHEESRILIEEKFEQLENYCFASDDQIIMSDFAVLYKKARNKEWGARKDEVAWMRSLAEKMESKEYWVRAHAAGAVGRRNAVNSYTLLKNRIMKELNLIYEQKPQYQNSIKVISYSVEAICELSENREEGKKETICYLTELLDRNRLRAVAEADEDDKAIEAVGDAYSTIATGIEYMVNPDPNKLPFNLGGRFRNHAITYQKVLWNTFEMLEKFWEADIEELEKVRVKREELEKIEVKKEEKEENIEKKELSGLENETHSNTIRILQLSDWHYTGANADNNMIVRKVKGLKEIDILLITGDLKDYKGDYTETLTTLKEITEGLGLTPEDVFMVPGNHDCEDYDGKEELIKEIRNNIEDDKEFHEKNLDKLYQGFRSYEGFLEEYYGKDKIEQGDLHNSLSLWKDKLYILRINTSLVCDEHSKEDKLVNIEELSRLETKNKNLPVICISHHKISQLDQRHQDTVKAMLEELRVSIVFSGDIHQSTVDKICTRNCEIPNYIIGKFLGDTKDNYSDRNIAVYNLDIEKKELKAEVYKWNKSDWGPDPVFLENLEDKWKQKTIKLL